MNPNQRRLQREWDHFHRDPIVGCFLEKINNDLHHWKAKMLGPLNSFYEHGQFELDVQLCDDYPMKPPKIVFITKIFHCQIYENGNIKLDILKEKWSPG